MEKGQKRMSWEDAYYDGIIADHDGFCEDTQGAASVSWYLNQGWDRYEDDEE